MTDKRCDHESNPESRGKVSLLPCANGPLGWKYGMEFASGRMHTEGYPIPRRSQASLLQQCSICQKASSLTFCHLRGVDFVAVG